MRIERILSNPWFYATLVGLFMGAQLATAFLAGRSAQAQAPSILFTWRYYPSNADGQSGIVLYRVPSNSVQVTVWSKAGDVPLPPVTATLGSRVQFVPISFANIDEFRVTRVQIVYEGHVWTWERPKAGEGYEVAL